MPAERLSIAIHAGTFERIHYALVMASAALAVNRPATLFVTGDAVAALQDWRKLPGAERDAVWRGRGVAGFEELLAACRDLGARVIVCEMALRAAGLTPGDLRVDLPIEVAGVVTFLQGGGQILFI